MNKENNGSAVHVQRGILFTSAQALHKIAIAQGSAPVGGGWKQTSLRSARPRFSHKSLRQLGDVSQRHGKAAVRDTGQPGMRVYAINAQSAGPCRVRAEKRKLSPSHGGMLPRRASERTWQKAASTFAFPKPIRSRFSRPNFSCFCRSDVPQRETSETSKKALSGGELTN